MTTANQIIAAAIGRSTKNRAGVLAEASTELLRMVNLALAGCFSIAAEVNPQFFAESDDVAFADGGWARPAEAENVFRIEDSEGAEIVVVPYDDQAAEPGMGALYPLGQVFRSAGGDNDPTSGSLTFFYSKRPTLLAELGDEIEALWPTQYDDLLSTDIAAYLAAKDGRTDEARALADERNRWLVLFVKFLEHETTNMRRRFGHRRRFNTQSIVAEFAPYLLSGEK